MVEFRSGRAAIAFALVALLWLTACSVDEHPGGSTEEPSPPAAATPLATAAPEPSIQPPAMPADLAPPDPVASEEAQRLAAAQAYFDRARADAEERHRSATGTCHAGGAPDFDTCIAVADESLQAEMRAARVEFDARMTQPN